MSCTISGNDGYNGALKFVTLSGIVTGSAETEQCIISANDSNVRHIVKVQPKRRRYSRIEVNGKILTGRGGPAAKYDGGGTQVHSSKLEWSDDKPINTKEVVFADVCFRHVALGQEEVKVQIHARSPWSGQFKRMDQGDLCFNIRLIP